MFRIAFFTLAFCAPLFAADPDPFDQSGVPIEEQPADPKAHKIVLIAGLASPKMKAGEHEYFAGCALLYKMLKQSPGIAPVMVRDGWPKKPDTLMGAKAVVMFVEGADVHTAIKGDRFNELMKLEKAGVGLVHLHSAIDYPKDFADRVRTLSGGAFEKGYSLRAHWIGEFDKFSEHPIMRGVTPFKIDDGWLWKHRFVSEMKGVTPLMRTKSPKDMGKTSADDSIVGWAYDRPNGGKSFTFTGCHLHESWKSDGFRRFIVNGILWSAGQEIPKDGAPVVLKVEDEKRHLDPKPAKK